MSLCSLCPEQLRSSLRGHYKALLCLLCPAVIGFLGLWGWATLVFTESSKSHLSPNNIYSPFPRSSSDLGSHPVISWPTILQLNVSQDHLSLCPTSPPESGFVLTTPLWHLPCSPGEPRVRSCSHCHNEERLLIHRPLRSPLPHTRAGLRCDSEIVVKTVRVCERKPQVAAGMGSATDLTFGCPQSHILEF